MEGGRRAERERAIEAAAYEILAERGYGGTSMLLVAQRARASNETMYRWYGDKNGLFAAMVRRNAQAAGERLEAALGSSRGAGAILRDVAPVLLGLVLGERAVALNRAAAADPTGDLGRIIAEGGRRRIVPLIAELLRRERPDIDGEALAELFIALVIGDQQIRRIVGDLGPPDDAAIARRVAWALDAFARLSGIGGDRP